MVGKSTLSVFNYKFPDTDVEVSSIVSPYFFICVFVRTSFVSLALIGR